MSETTSSIKAGRSFMPVTVATYPSLSLNVSDIHWPTVPARFGVWDDLLPPVARQGPTVKSELVDILLLGRSLEKCQTLTTEKLSLSCKVHGVVLEKIEARCHHRPEPACETDATSDRHFYP